MDDPEEELKVALARLRAVLHEPGPAGLLEKLVARRKRRELVREVLALYARSNEGNRPGGERTRSILDELQALLAESEHSMDDGSP